MLTILPDHLYCRCVQGKRLGKEIELFSVWFELHAAGYAPPVRWNRLASTSAQNLRSVSGS